MWSNETEFVRDFSKRLKYALLGRGKLPTSEEEVVEICLRLFTSEEQKRFESITSNLSDSELNAIFEEILGEAVTQLKDKEE